MPSNDAPQAGSTTAVGNGVEGVWVVADDSFSGFAVIDPAGNYLSFDPAGILLDGRIALSGTQWSFVAPTRAVALVNGTPILGTVAGSGTVSLRRSFDGLAGTVTPIAYRYSVANALAVSQSDVAATWTASGASLAIDAAGAMTGQVGTTTFGDCAIAGTVMLAEPGSRKNFYAISLTLGDAPGGTCRLDTTKTYTGNGAITFTNEGNAQSPLYIRSFTFMARAADDRMWISGVLRKS